MRKVILLLLVSSCFAQVSVKGSVAIKGSVKVTGNASGSLGMAQNSALLLGSTSNFTQTPSLCPNDSSLAGPGGPCPVNITGTWTSMAYSQEDHCFYGKSLGGHVTDFGNEGWQDCFSTSGSIHATAKRMQIGGVDDPYITPQCPGDSNNGQSNLNYILPFTGTTPQCNSGTVANTSPAAPNYDQGQRGTFHTYAGICWIPQSSISKYGVTGKAIYMFGGYGPGNPAHTFGDTWIWGMDSNDFGYGKMPYLTPTITVSGGTESSNDMVCQWDSASGLMFLTDNGGNGIQLWKHDINAGTKTRVANVSDSGQDTGNMGTIYPPTNEWIQITWHNTSTRKIYKINLTSGTSTDITSLFSTCSFFTQSESNAGDLKYPGMAYNADNQTIGILGTETGIHTFWEIKPDGTCNALTLTGDSIPQSSTSPYYVNGVYGRLAYDSTYHIYMYLPTQPNLQTVAICTKSGGC